MPLDKATFRFLTMTFAALAVLSLVGYDFLAFTGPGKEDPFRNGQARYMMLAAGGLVTWALMRCNPFWALFWGYSAVLWIVGDWAWYGMMDLVCIGGCLVVGDAVRCFFEPKTVIRWFAWLAALQAAYVLLQVSGLDLLLAANFVGRFHNEALGTLGHFTLVGAFVGLGAVVFFEAGLREMRNLAGFLLCMAAVVACHSTMAILGTAAGIWYVLLRRDLALTAMSTYFGGAGLALFWWYRPSAEFFGFSGREVVWPYVVRAWLESPIFGRGPGYWAGALPTQGIQGVAQARWYQAHNDFLQVLPEQGALGLLIVLVGLAFLFRAAHRMSPVFGAVALAICVGSLGNFLMHVVCFGVIASWIACSVHHHEMRRTQ